MSNKVIELTQVGDFKTTIRWLQKLRDLRLEDVLTKYGEKGVALLSNATPRRTGKTALSWRYEIEITTYSVTLSFHNDSMGSDGSTPIVFLIQLGHGTKNGGYVPPNDFMSPILIDLYQELETAVWEAVKAV